MIIVTGASGFIGGNVARHISLAQQNKEGGGVIAVDEYASIRGHGCVTSPPVMETRGDDAAARPMPPAAGYIDLHDLFDFLAGDRTGVVDGRLTAADVTAVIHLGACADTTETDRQFMMSRNYDYSVQLWQWCTEWRVPLVYASSAATYGDGERGYDDEADPSPLEPLNLYAESKQRFDLWALDQPSAPPIWRGVKFFNVYGPGERHKGKMASMTMQLHDQAKRSGQVRLFKSYRDDVADGEQRRDFIHVDDVVAAVLHLLRTPQALSSPNGLYNVGTGVARSFNELAAAVFDALRLPANIQYIDMPDAIREKYQYFTEATTSKLRRSGFTQPFLSLEQGVRRYVQHLSRPETRHAVA